MNFVWCVVPSTIIPCWFLFANRIGLLSCMTRRKYDIEWRSDHMSTGVSWWEQLSKLPADTSRAILGWDHNGLSRVTIHAAPISKWSILSGSSMVNACGRALTAVSSFCNLFWCPFVAIQWREARFINVSFCAEEDYHGHHHCHYHHGPSPAQLLSSGSDQCEGQCWLSSSRQF